MLKVLKVILKIVFGVTKNILFIALAFIIALLLLWIFSNSDPSAYLQ